VGIATFFFFQPGVASVALMLVGCVVAALLTYAMRRFVPFPTYTTPFILTTWVIFFLGPALGAARVAAGDAPAASRMFVVESVAHGVGQVMFQASIWTGILFLLGIAVSNWHHAAWVLAGSVIGMLVGGYHMTASSRALDPERLVERAISENIALGLYGYNATLAAVALYLARRNVALPVLGILLAVLLTEVFPMVGLPALTAPFVAATWLVLGLGWLERWLFGEPTPVSA
jgi:urea transporter